MSAPHSAMSLEPVTLSGRVVRLEPLALDHVAALARVGLDPELWRLQPTAVDSPEAMRAYVEKALADRDLGTALPFAIVDARTDEVIGSTRFMDVAPRHRRLEIGATWLAPAAQRTGANTEAKLLLLGHAFERLGAIRVVFKTEAGNARSRAALARLGAVEEGTFRRHLLADSGRARDMVYFAILDDEWPGVKARLERLLARGGPRASGGDTMSTSEGETIANDWFENVWNRGDGASIDRLFAADGVAHGLAGPDGVEPRGPEQFKPFWASFRGAFPDLRIDVTHAVTEGDMCAARCLVTGTHTGEGLGVAATHKPVEFTGMVLFRVRDGQIVEAWNNFDFATMNAQLV